MFPASGGWSGKITRLQDHQVIPALELYQTQDSAKLAAFDGMIWMKERHIV